MRIQSSDDALVIEIGRIGLVVIDRALLPRC
jgi:hypothetical protein